MSVLNIPVIIISSKSNGEFERNPASRAKDGTKRRLFKVYRSASDSGKRILWINGEDFFDPQKPHVLANMITDSSYANIEALNHNLDAFVNEIRIMHGMDIGKGFMLIVHYGQLGEVSLTMRWERINKLLEELKIKITFLFASSTVHNVNFDRTPKLISLKITGLSGTVTKNLPEIIEQLSKIVPGKKQESHSLFIRCVEFENKLLKLLEEDWDKWQEKVEQLFTEYNEPIIVGLRPQLVKRLEKAESGENVFRLFSFERNNEKFIPGDISESKPVFRNMIALLVRPGLQQKARFIYLPLETLSKENYDVTYVFSNTINGLPAPYIFVTIFDLLLHTKDGDNCPDHNKDFLSGIDKRFRFFDSSIWFRLMCFLSDDPEVNAVQDDIENLIESDFYSIHQATESREFSTRLFNISHVNVTGWPGSHGLEIAPFLFHSEAGMKKEVEILLKEDARLFRSIEWELLLIDDQAVSALPDCKRGLTKEGLICRILEKFAPSIGKGDGLTKVIRIYASAVTVESAEKELRLNNKKEEPAPAQSLSLAKSSGDNKFFYWPDAILLDYLLNTDDEVEFSDEIIRNICQQNKQEKKPVDKDEFKLGANGKLWFFPVSAYTTTIQNKLHEHGIPMYSESCIIAPGADPISTPYLFLYDLLVMLRSQFRATIRVPRELKAEFHNENPLLYYLKRLGKNHVEVRREAIEIFPGIVELTANYKMIKSYSQKSSFFSTFYEHYCYSLESYEMEQLRDVIYLLAYGGVNDVNRLWGEWAITKDILTRKLNRDGSEADLLDTLINNIDTYISA